MDHPLAIKSRVYPITSSTARPAKPSKRMLDANVQSSFVIFSIERSPEPFKQNASFHHAHARSTCSGPWLFKHSRARQTSARTAEVRHSVVASAFSSSRNGSLRVIDDRIAWKLPRIQRDEPPMYVLKILYIARRSSKPEQATHDPREGVAWRHRFKTVGGQINY